jgi:predicted small metal-binding protein
MKTTLDCPCGVRIEGKDEDELVLKVQEHLKEKHPNLEYSRDEILFVAR